MSYTLNVNINGTDDLIHGNWNLCVAIGVNKTFNVVWIGDMDYKNGKKSFHFDDNYSVVVTNEFKDGDKAIVYGASDIIKEGQRIFFTDQGFNKPFDKVSAGKPIYLNVKTSSETYFGLTAGDPLKSLRPIFVFQCEHHKEWESIAPYHELGRVPELLVWFDQNLGTGAMFKREIENPYYGVFLSGLEELNVTYDVMDKDNLAGGRWTTEIGPSMPKTYNPETNTFKPNEKTDHETLVD